MSSLRNLRSVQASRDEGRLLDIGSSAIHLQYALHTVEPHGAHRECLCIIPASILQKVDADASMGVWVALSGGDLKKQAEKGEGRWGGKSNSRVRGDITASGRLLSGWIWLPRTSEML